MGLRLWRALQPKLLAQTADLDGGLAKPDITACKMRVSTLAPGCDIWSDAVEFPIRECALTPVELTAAIGAVGCRHP